MEIVRRSVEKMGFSDRLFDLITAIEAYYFWPAFSGALQEILRVLKPGGHLLMVNEMVKDGVYEVKYAKIIGKAHVHLVPLGETRDALEAVGFEDVQIFTKSGSPWNAVLAKKH